MLTSVSKVAGSVTGFGNLTIVGAMYICMHLTLSCDCILERRLPSCQDIFSNSAHTSYPLDNHTGTYAVDGEPLGRRFHSELPDDHLLDGDT